MDDQTKRLKRIPFTVCDRLLRLRESREKLEEKLKGIKKDEQACVDKIAQAMVGSDVPQFKHAGRTFSLSIVDIPKIEGGEDSWDALAEAIPGFGQLIRKTVHPQSFGALFREWAGDNPDRALKLQTDGRVSVYKRTTVNTPRN